MKNPEIKKVLLLGSGALKIGQAGEFDYSGSQALKALKEEGIETVLVNPNIATVQTSEGVADKVYFLPVTPEFVKGVIEKERPQGILLSFGGQTALNCGVALHESGTLEKYGVKVLGTPVRAIMDTEDRELFVERLDEIGVNTIKSHPAHSVAEAKAAAKSLGYPVIIRAAYALGGLGSGFCDSEEELVSLCSRSFSFSGEVLVEKSLKGWKEIEYEVVRDSYDNCITVCNMENFDPLGIHTGESIVVAPSQTLSNKDYFHLREIAIRIVRHIGIVGECNVQYAYDPDSMDYKVIEVNARLSRSSALASKATGYPLAFIAAKLALGYGLFDLSNSVTKTTPAFFEPALDYVVCKIPRWDLAKFAGVSRRIGSSMKSVGEVMSIGRTFEEALQKGLRSIGQGAEGFVCNKMAKTPDSELEEELKDPTDSRIFVISQCLQEGWSVDRIHLLTRIDKWFLYKLKGIVDLAGKLKTGKLDHEILIEAKRKGFSDKQIGLLVGKSADDIREERKKEGIVPRIKQIDTLAAEFPAKTNYLYLTYGGDTSDVVPEDDGKSVIVIGSGAYRIGSSVEFDWCSVTCLDTLRQHGRRGIMINCNPETVSTDYDICDRLYFEELTLERVMDIIDAEKPGGVVVSVGGQIPNNLAMSLEKRGVPILGTDAYDIDKAEDRDKFSSIVDSLGIDQPAWTEATSLKGVEEFIAKVGFPVLVRPSYVLSGAAMNVCHDEQHLSGFLSAAAEVSSDHPVVISKFMQRCREVEYDAVADGGKILQYAISEHVEYAGVHSGDATIVFPPQRLYVETIRKIRNISSKIAGALHISGPFNIQFLARDNDVLVIECNLRASRSFPFVSKVMKVNLIELATEVMLGEHPASPGVSMFDIPYVGVKAAQFSFSRLDKADPMLGVDMSSTGEVGCFGDDMDEALLKSLISVGNPVPYKTILLSTGDARQKADMLPSCRKLAAKGFRLYATGGTYKYLTDNDVPCMRALWPSEESNPALKEMFPTAMDLIRRKSVDMVVNIPKDYTERELDNGYHIRRAAVDHNIPLFTDPRLSMMFIKAFTDLPKGAVKIKAREEY